MYKNILIPLLLAPEHDAAPSFAAATALGDPDATYTVLHVLETIPSYAAVEIPGDVIAARRQAVAHDLTECAKGLPGAKAQLISGHSGRAILDFADANDIDCIIIASHQPGLEDYFLGSTASRIVRHAKCAVHVMR